MTATGAIAGQMIEAASRLIEALDSEQTRITCSTFPDDDERRLWFYTPTDHGGLALGAMTARQHQLVHALVASGLSTAGYVTATTIMGLENILDRVEGWREVQRRERFRDPLLYYITIFGEPAGQGAWAWRFGGHHISLHYLIIDGEVVAATPNFFGANPADSPLLGPHLHRPLAAIEDLGRELFRALDDNKRRQALLSPEAPSDLITGNRSALQEGERQLIRPGSRENRAAIEGVAMEDGLSFSFTPRGVGPADLAHGEIDILRELIGCYLDRLPDALADQQATLVDQEFDKIRFAWAGSDQRRQPHYYRIQGERLLIEYDNTQNGANHIHAVWRDLANDFGGDVLARHYAARHVPPAHG
ncbi:MAG: DUF3500 domain-containing protein [Alphaproteobacteria bacterium]|nr:DUF3500 domain-containing protein [Alphaproteobacteria bacterium]